MLARLLRWFFVEPLYFWIAFSVPAATVIITVGIARSEPAIRLAGLGLQLLGILTAVWGIVETWKYFQLGDPLGRIKDWFRRCPLRKLPPITGGMTVTEQADSLAARAFTWWEPKPQAPLEERLQILEKNIPLLNERITNTQRELEFAIAKLQQQAGQATALAQQVEHQLSKKIADFGTGSLHISAIGAFWLFVGSIMGTASQEILRFLQ